MAVFSKISEMRERAAAAMEDVPDNLIGMIIALVVLTVIGLGALIAFGYFFTNA